LLLAVLAEGVGLYFLAYPNLPEHEVPEALHYLEPWDATQRQTYYYTPQGTQIRGWSTTDFVRWSCPAAGTGSPYPTISPALPFWSIPRNKPLR